MPKKQNPAALAGAKPGFKYLPQIDNSKSVLTRTRAPRKPLRKMMLPEDAA